jgi:hypothetical protein
VLSEVSQISMLPGVLYDHNGASKEAELRCSRRVIMRNINRTQDNISDDYIGESGTLIGPKTSSVMTRSVMATACTSVNPEH